MVDDFINRKHGRSDGAIDYLHPSLEPILKPTYGVILTRSSVMHDRAGAGGLTTLGGATLLRRAMARRSPKRCAAALVFVSGAVARGVREPLAVHIST